MTSTTRPHPIDRFIPWMFVAFFVCLAVLLASFVCIAAKNDRGVITTNAYQKGLKYNQVLAAEEAQKKLGWHVVLSHRAEGGRDVVFHVMANDRHNQPLAGAVARLVYMRPVQSGMDGDMMMTEVAAGHFQASVALPVPGLWQVYAVVRRGDDEFQTMQRVNIAPQ
ncbi:MAG: hypothetical protein EBZ69_03680 [Alphaproteobacteria bacterium]|nr:hypothetical protein [Alphaproteobacteria bacterium]NDC55901.1 hypothetical protein [Alphaproteobacteria bacterium]NDG04298.1 hypothetical protein [Alphaproteobacteria bacterium]